MTRESRFIIFNYSNRVKKEEVKKRRLNLQKLGLD